MSVCFLPLKSAVWGLGIMQILNADAFILSGWIRVKLGAEKGGMTRWHTKVSLDFHFDIRELAD